MRAGIIFILVAQMATYGQQGSTPSVPKGTYKFEATSQLVVVNVSARDKSGAPLEGLKAADFTVTEDGKAQQVKVFEFQRLEDAPAVVQPAAAAPEAAKPPVAAPVKAANAIAPAKPGEVKYKDRRLLVLFFDQAGMPVADQIRAQRSAAKFLQTQMTPSDMVAVMTYATTLNVVQDFTADRDVLNKAIRGLTAADTGTANGSTGYDSEADSGAAYTADDSEFNIFNTDRQLAALESAVKMLGSLAEKKALVYFASGMTRTGTDNQAQLRATVNAAIRNNVAFYPVDARGLVATAPLGDATQGSQGGQGMYSGSSQRSAQSNFQAQQETLHTLAADTGGKALLDNNDLSLGVVQAQKDIPQRVLRRQGVQAVHLQRPRAAIAGSAASGRPSHGSDRGSGDQLLPPWARPLLRAGFGEDSRQRYRTGAEGRCREHEARFHWRGARCQGHDAGHGAR